jgi:ABC-type multidrug transport system permease subunit
MGVQATFSYPMNFALSQIGLAVEIVTFSFLNRIVSNTPIVANDFLSFVVIGIVGQAVVTGALRGLGSEMDLAIQQGRLEMLLIEPLRWSAIPAGLALWPIVLSLGQALVALVVGLAFGVGITVSHLPLALLLVALGVLSGLALGILASSIRILAKRSDPVWLLYFIASGLVAGITVPINVLPAPLRAVSWALPTTYVNSGLRKILLPHASAVYGPSGLWSTIILAAAVIPLTIVAVLAFNQSVQVGRRLGVLAGY